MRAWVPTIDDTSTSPRRVKRLGALSAAAALTCAGAASAVPSAVVSYANTPPAIVDDYAGPGNVIVVTAQQGEVAAARIKAWRAKGTIVLAYVDAIDWYGGSGGLFNVQRELYGTLGTFPSAWKLGGYSNYGGTPALDLRASSPVATFNGFTGQWGEYVANYVKNRVIKDGSVFNGVFLDVWGGKLWNGNLGGITGNGSDWEAGIAKFSKSLRDKVGPNIFIVGNSTQTPATARYINGRMWESFGTHGWNELTGGGLYPGVIESNKWTWAEPRLSLLWRNEANPSQDTKNFLLSSAKQAGAGFAVGSADLGTGVPAPFGGGGGTAPPFPVVPASVTPAPVAPAPKPPTPATPATTGGTAVKPTSGGANAGGSSGSAVTTTPGVAAVPGQPGKVAGSWKADQLKKTWKNSSGARVKVVKPKKGAQLLRVQASLGRNSTLSTPLADWKSLSVDTNLRLGSMSARGRSPRVVTSVADSSGRLSAGIARGSDGRLHWAMWRGLGTTPTNLAVSKELVPSGKWTGVSMSLNRDAKGIDRRLVVDGRTVLIVRDPQLSGKNPRLHVGLAGASRKPWAGVIDLQQVGLSALAA